MTLQFQVINQEIFRLDANKIVEGSSNYVKLRFVFSDDWKDTTKTITFKQLIGNEEVVETLPNDNTIVVPNEVLTFPGFSIDIVGVANDMTISTEHKIVFVNKFIL